MRIMLLRRTLLIILSLSNSAFIIAQNDKPADAPIQKEYTSLTPMANLSVEYFYNNNSCIYYTSMYNFNETLRNRITNSIRLYNKIGAEINAGGNWYMGASATHQLSYLSMRNIISGKANITHRGKIGKYNLIKALGAEYFHHLNDPFFDNQKDIQASIGVALSRSFQVAKKPLSAMVSYKVILNTPLEFGIYQDRMIDFTRLRADVYYGITDYLYIGLFILKETEYYYPPGTSTNTNPPVNVYYKINAIKPVIGLNINVVLQRKLMDNYIPGLPLL